MTVYVNINNNVEQWQFVNIIKTIEILTIGGFCLNKLRRNRINLLCLEGIIE